MARPVLLIDVDGPLNPYAAKPTKRPEGYLTHRMKPKGFEYGQGLRVWLNPLHGPSLMALEADLVWATMWEGDANKLIGPELGLPELPFIDFGATKTTIIPKTTEQYIKVYFKSPRIAYKMNKNFGGRPFLWIDDEITHHDEEFLAEACGVPVKAMTIDPRIGLTDQDFKEIAEWFAQFNEEEENNEDLGQDAS